MPDMREFLHDGPDDGEEAGRWRGELFPPEAWNLYEVMWRDAGKGHYCHIEQPRSVTFPICSCCGRIVWTWPHFEEPVPEGAACDHCSRDWER
jgi:hypothetical protein